MIFRTVLSIAAFLVAAATALVFYVAHFVCTGGHNIC